MSMFLAARPGRGALLIALVLWATGASGAPAPLSLEDAEVLALARDPVAARHRELASGLQAESVAEGQLPDPTMQLGLANFPTDTFDRSQEPVTQAQIGVRQLFPRGDSLAIRTARAHALASAQQAQAQARTRTVTREVREAWAELRYWQQAEKLVAENRTLFSRLVEITERQYAAGRHNQQDVVRAELELSALEDRITKIRTRQASARADLVKLVGPAANGALMGEGPMLADVPARGAIAKRLPSHPLLQVEGAQLQARREGVALARESYLPAFAVGVTYGARSGHNPNGSDRADFVSATLSFDLPLFRNKRQDQRLAAAQRRAAAATRGRDEQLLQLQRDLAADYADWQRLGERLALYREQLLRQARRNAEASLSAYQNDRTDFTTLMRARITELETELRQLRLQTDRFKAHAGLLYLAGEPK